MLNIQNNQQQGSDRHERPVTHRPRCARSTGSTHGESLNLAPTGWNTAIRTGAFSPLGELRFNLQYQVFNKASLNVGWTGLIVGGISRPSDIINYQLPNMGLLVHGNNRQSVFMQGLTLAGLHLQPLNGGRGPGRCQWQHPPLRLT